MQFPSLETIQRLIIDDAQGEMWCGRRLDFVAMFWPALAEDAAHHNVGIDEERLLNLIHLDRLAEFSKLGAISEAKRSVSAYLVSLPGWSAKHKTIPYEQHFYIAARAVSLACPDLDLRPDHFGLLASQ